MVDHVTIIGAGLTGCTIAERLASRGVAVEVYEKASTVGGLCADGYTHDGFLTPCAGPHIFHTKDRVSWEYLSQFTDWLPYIHYVRADVGGKLVPVPINDLTLDMLGMDVPQAMDAIYRQYSEKFWGPWASMVWRDACSRVIPRRNLDCRYFTDRYQGLPIQGFTVMMERMVDCPNIHVHLGVRIEDIPDTCPVVFTGRVDALCGFDKGILSFRSIKFDYMAGVAEQHFPVINHPSQETRWFRSTDVGVLWQQRRPRPFIIRETATDCGQGGIPTHPIIVPENMAMWADYKTALPPNVILAGRCATMRHLDMGVAVADALAVADTIIAS